MQGRHGNHFIRAALAGLNCLYGGERQANAGPVKRGFLSCLYGSEQELFTANPLLQ
jgi:hypothetical protein